MIYLVQQLLQEEKTERKLKEKNNGLDTGAHNHRGFRGFFYLSHLKMDTKFGQIDNKFEHLGDRIGKVENRLTAMEVEIKNVNQRLSTIESYLVPKKFYRIDDHSKDEPKEN